MFLLLDQVSFLVIVYSIIICQYPLLLFGYLSWFVAGLVCKFVWQEKCGHNLLGFAILPKNGFFPITTNTVAAK